MQSYLLEQTLKDALNAVKHLYGPEGLRKVVDQMERINRGREHRAELDALENTSARIKDTPPTTGTDR